jgi:hypothetical protein
MAKKKKTLLDDVKSMDPVRNRIGVTPWYDQLQDNDPELFGEIDALCDEFIEGGHACSVFGNMSQLYRYLRGENAQGADYLPSNISSQAFRQWMQRKRESRNGKATNTNNRRS